MAASAGALGLGGTAAPVRRPFAWRKRSAIPGFGLSLGYTALALAIVVVAPLGALLLKASEVGLSGFAATVSDPRVQHALVVSFGSAFAAALTASGTGLLVAWALARYRFPGRRIVDAIVDLPFAMPTAVAGIALATLYAPNGWIGGLLNPYGIKLAFTPAAIFIALVFVSLPFAVRTVQPLIEEIDGEIEEAAATLGAGRARAIRTVILPLLVPGILTGFVMAFARSVGEYGSVIFVAGNLPYVSEIAPLLIVIKLEEFNYAGATAIAAIMLAISFVTLLAINLIQASARRKFGHA